MSEKGLVELPVVRWLSGYGAPPPGTAGLGWTYRDEAAMATFDRPLEDPLVEKILIECIKRINPAVKTNAQAGFAVAALRNAMSHPDKLIANRQTLDLLRDGARVTLNPGEDTTTVQFIASAPPPHTSTILLPPTSIVSRASNNVARIRFFWLTASHSLLPNTKVT